MEIVLTDGGRKFKEGQVARGSTTFTDERAGHANFDPVTVVARFKSPTHQLVTPPTTRVTLGVWEYLCSLVPHGTWWARIEGLDGSGNLIAVDEFPLEVEPSHF